MLPSTELGHQKTEHRTGGSQGRTKTEQLYVRDSSAVAVVDDEPGANRNKMGSGGPTRLGEVRRRTVRVRRAGPSKLQYLLNS
jgi:hypothetical protein